MPRKKRLVIPNSPHLVLHRGYDGNAIFVGDEDYCYYLDNLWLSAQELGCKIYAYCLLLNQVQLIVDPGEDRAHLGRLMKTLAGRQAGYAKRRGTLNGSPLWKRRFFSSPITDGQFLSACSRYIELLPVYSCLASRPEEYRWSSCRTKLGMDVAPIYSDPAYLSLASTGTERADCYRRYLSQKVPEQEWMAISRILQPSGLVTRSSSDVCAPLLTLIAPAPAVMIS